MSGTSIKLILGSSPPLNVHSWDDRIQPKKDPVLTTSTTIGINLWLAPQISEHCPKKMPGRWAKNFNWFRRPGTASALTPKAGTVQACSTSAEEISIRICALRGITVRLSTSKSRKSPPSPSVPIYASNSSWALSLRDQKSEYSYLQYHWWPTTLIDKTESIDSSNMYNRRSEGSAIWTKMTAGITVHTHSTIWLSRRFWLMNVLLNIRIIIRPTNVIIKIKIVLIKSCNKTNSSIIGEFASWRPYCLQCIILNNFYVKIL